MIEYIRVTDEQNANIELITLSSEIHRVVLL